MEGWLVSMNASIFMMRLHYRLGGIGYAGVVLILVGLTLGCYAIVQHRLTGLTRVQLEQTQLNLPAETKTANHPSKDVAWPRVDEAASLMATLEQSAQLNGIKIQKIDFASSSISPSNLGALEIKCLMYSSYPRIRAFLSELLNRHPSMAIEALAISRDSIQSPDVEVRATLRVYFADGWGPKPSAVQVRP